MQPSPGSRRPGFAALFLLSAVLLPVAAAHAVVTLDQEYDSGSMNVGASSVNMADPLRPTISLVVREAYFQVRATGVNGLRPTFVHTNASYMTNTHRYWWSYDNRNWVLFDHGSLSGANYVFYNDAAFTQNVVYVAQMLPFPTWRTDELVASVKSSPYVFRTASADANLVIGRTLGTAGGGYYDDQGRVVPAMNMYGFKITDANYTLPKVKVVLITGNHPPEYTGTYVHEGLVLFLLSDDPRAAVLRRKAEFYVYPEVNPEGRFTGMPQTSPQVPYINHNRVWHDPYGYGDTQVQIVEAAAKADTGSSNVEYFFDFHSWTTATTLEISIRYNVVGTTFINTMLALEPGLTLPKYDNSDGYSDTWAVAAEGLGATYGLIPEWGLLAGVDANGYHNYGSHYGIALYEALKNHVDGDLAPVVNAGADRYIVAPTNQVSLAGTVSDDGLPQGAALSYIWSKGTGPGTVTFGSPNALTTTATFSTYGTYRLRLNASDTDINGHDDLRVVYTAAPANHTPVVSAGSDAIINAPATSLSLAGSVSDDGLPSGAAVSATWTKEIGPGTVTFANAGAAATSATFSMQGTYLLRLTTGDTALSSYDEVHIIYTGPPVNQAPAVNAGPDQTITLPTTSVSLSGSVSDDGLPAGAAVTAAWSVVSGPGSVIFADANAPSTTATFSTLGTYVLRLTAGDTELTSHDDVQVVVAPPPVNQAPAVNAGADRSIALPINSLSLSGSVSDDGLPAGGAVTAAWSMVSGPGTVIFANANAAATTATFPAVGTYVLRLTAGDTELSGSDTCQVTVQPASPLVLALYLPFDEGAGATAYDGSGNGRNGTLVNGPAWVAAKVGGGLQFDEFNDYVLAPSFALNNQFTLSFWFADKNVYDPYYRYMFSWGYVGTVNSINVWIFEDGGVSSAWLRTDIQDYNGPNRQNYGDIKDPIVADGQWHHYCATVANGVGLTVYLDGVPRVTDASVGGGAIVPPGDPYIGCRNDRESERFFGGKIDEVRIYNQALSAADVLALYQGANNTAPTADAGPDLAVSLLTGSTLAGSVSDDGLPGAPAALASNWTVISGPGTVTFADATAAQTTATFSAVGTYVLRLTANDSALSASDEATITVDPILGDFNDDGRVDGLDFLVWQAHFPTTSGATRTDGDATGDGKVDGLDFLAWQSAYQP